jgi:hypothetical protein
MMKVIKTDKSVYIKPDGKVEYDGKQHSVFGHRWIRNADQWSKLCTLITFDAYAWINYSELPRKLPDVEVKR